MASQGKKWMLFSGAAAAATLFYFLEDERGKQRRTAFSRKARRLAASVAGRAGKYASDVQHRLKRCSARGTVQPSPPPAR
jgi:hypothetical protein